MPATEPLTNLPAWQALKQHFTRMKSTSLRDLFANDPGRGTRLTAEAEGLFLDYSKNRVTDETIQLLVQLANEVDLKGRTEAMFTGQKINITENRAVLHVALRAPESESIMVDGEDVVPEVHKVLDKMSAFTDRIRSGEWKGYNGKRIRNVVNIGIGGSDLGPVMAFEAHRFCRSRHRSAPRRNPVPRSLQDLHHARDHDQRPHRPRLVPPVGRR